MTIGERLVKDISEAMFLKDFIFYENVFKKRDGNEDEFSDHFLLLDDLLLMIEVKDRNSDLAQQSDAKWFDNKIKHVAKDQIKKNVKLYKNGEDITLRNARGYAKNIQDASIRYWINIIVYVPHRGLSSSNQFPKFIKSRTVGIIHILSIDELQDIIATYQTPFEIARYLLVREGYAKRFPEEMNKISEKALMGTAIHSEIMTEGQQLIVIRPEEKYLPFYYGMKHVDLNPFRRFLENISTTATTFNREGNVRDEKPFQTMLSSYSKLGKKEILQLEQMVLRVQQKCNSKEFNSEFNALSDPRIFVPRLSTCFYFLGISENRDGIFEEMFRTYSQWLLYNIGKEYKGHNKIVGIGYTKDGDTLKSFSCCLEKEWAYDERMEELSKHLPYRPLTEVAKGFF